LEPVAVVEVETLLAVADAVEALVDGLVEVRVSLLSVLPAVEEAPFEAPEAPIENSDVFAVRLVAPDPVALLFLRPVVVLPAVTLGLDEVEEPPSTPPGLSVVTAPPHPTPERSGRAATTIAPLDVTGPARRTGARTRLASTATRVSVAACRAEGKCELSVRAESSLQLDPSAAASRRASASTMTRSTAAVRAGGSRAHDRATTGDCSRARPSSGDRRQAAASLSFSFFTM
jgi:hypothetical protein